MADGLTLNGIPVPVRSGFARSNARAADTVRAYSGRARRTGRTLKREWQHTTTALTRVEGRAVQGLVEGEGHTLTFDTTSLFTERGEPRASGTGGRAGTGEPSKHGGANAFLVCGNDLWQLGFGAEWTVLGWRAYTDGTQPSGIRWDHHVRDSTLGTYYTNGAPGGTDVSTYLNVTTAGALNIGAGGGAYVDDVVALPYLLPAAWVPLLYAFHNARPWSPLPRLYAAGLLDADGEVLVEGEVTGVEYLQFHKAGAWHTGQRVSFTLREV